MTWLKSFSKNQKISQIPLMTFTSNVPVGDKEKFEKLYNSTIDVYKAVEAVDLAIKSIHATIKKIDNDIKDMESRVSYEKQATYPPLKDLYDVRKACDETISKLRVKIKRALTQLYININSFKEDHKTTYDDFMNKCPNYSSYVEKYLGVDDKGLIPSSNKRVSMC